MLISRNGQSFDWQNNKGELIPNVCPYFEGRKVIGYLNSKGKITDYQLKIYVNDNGIENDLTVPVGELSNPTKLMSALGNEGLIILKEQAKDASELLLKQARELRRSPTVEHKRLGIANLNKQTVFLQENNVVDSTNYQYDGKIKLHNGSKQQYESFLHNTVFKSRNLTLAYMIGMSASVVALLSNQNVVPYKMININFAGKSSTGKSTTAALALSPFGNPDFSSDGLGIAQSTTENAIYDTLDGVNGLPRVLDDINQNSQIKMEQLTYALYAAEPKRRLGKKYQGNECGWSGTSIITSETPLILEMSQKGGVHARVITLEMGQWTSSRDEAELVSREIAQNYGWTGEEFVTHLLNDINYVQQRYELIRQEVDSKITVRDSLTDRISGQIAAIALTVDCYLRYYKNPFEWSYLDLMEPFVISEQAMVEERDMGKKILNIVMEYISTNAINFNQHWEGFRYANGYHQPSQAYKPIGKITHQPADTKVVCIYGSVFKELMIRNGIMDYEDGLKQLRERKQLDCDNDGHLTTKINGIRSYCFLLHNCN